MLAYFPWFMRDIDLLTKSESEIEGDNIEPETHEFVQWLECSRSCLPQDDRSKNIWKLSPIAKRESYFAYAISRHGSYPHPGWISTGLDLWYKLGFCAAQDEYDEKGLGSVYSKLIGGYKSSAEYAKSLGIEHEQASLISTCSFEEFWHAYKSGRLIQLLDQYGLKECRLAYKHLDTFLNVQPGSSRPSIWRQRYCVELGPLWVQLWAFGWILVGERSHHPSEIRDTFTITGSHRGSLAAVLKD